MEGLHDKEKSLEELRKEFIGDFLERLLIDGKKSELEEGHIAVTLDGPYANIGMKVMYIEDNGMVHLRPSPENNDVVEITESKLYAFSDFNLAFALAYQKYPEPGDSSDKFINVSPE